jgi:hypothetical protein
MVKLANSKHFGAYSIRKPQSCQLILEIYFSESASLIFCKKGVLMEAPAKLLKARGNRLSGQAKRDPESKIFKRFWIPAPGLKPGATSFAGRKE